jgi:hypothetical protein
MAVRAKRKDERTDEYLTGIPNRDLEDEDWERLTDAEREEVIASTLWEVTPEPGAATAPSE